MANEVKTGWPPGLLQDDDRKLSRWFSSRPDARLRVRERCAEIRAEQEASQAKGEDHGNVKA